VVTRAIGIASTLLSILGAGGGKRFRPNSSLPRAQRRWVRPRQVGAAARPPPRGGLPAKFGVWRGGAASPLISLLGLGDVFSRRRAGHPDPPGARSASSILKFAAHRPPGSGSPRRRSPEQPAARTSRRRRVRAVMSRLAGADWRQLLDGRVMNNHAPAVEGLKGQPSAQVAHAPDSSINSANDAPRRHRGRR